MKAGYLSCSLLRLARAGCQQQLFLNCTDTYLVLTPHANINAFLQIGIWRLTLRALKSRRYPSVHQKGRMEGRSLGDASDNTTHIRKTSKYWEADCPVWCGDPGLRIAWGRSSCSVHGAHMLVTSVQLKYGWKNHRVAALELLCP